MKLSDKIKAEASKDTEWLQNADYRKVNEDWLDISFGISMMILKFIREQGMTQKELAEKLCFSPQYMSKILQGKENLTLETIAKLQKATGVTLIQVPSFTLEKAPVSWQIEITPERLLATPSQAKPTRKNKPIPPHKVQFVTDTSSDKNTPAPKPALPSPELKAK